MLPAPSAANRVEGGPQAWLHRPGFVMPGTSKDSKAAEAEEEADSPHAKEFPHRPHFEPPPTLSGRHKLMSRRKGMRQQLSRDSITGDGRIAGLGDSRACRSAVNLAATLPASTPRNSSSPALGFAPAAPAPAPPARGATDAPDGDPDTEDVNMQRRLEQLDNQPAGVRLSLTPSDADSRGTEVRLSSAFGDDTSSLQSADSQRSVWKTKSSNFHSDGSLAPPLSPSAHSTAGLGTPFRRGSVDLSSFTSGSSTSADLRQREAWLQASRIEVAKNLKKKARRAGMRASKSMPQVSYAGLLNLADTATIRPVYDQAITGSQSSRCPSPAYDLPIDTKDATPSKTANGNSLASPYADPHDAIEDAISTSSDGYALPADLRRGSSLSRVLPSGSGFSPRRPIKKKSPQTRRRASFPLAAQPGVAEPVYELAAAGRPVTPLDTYDSLWNLRAPVLSPVRSSASSPSPEERPDQEPGHAEDGVEQEEAPEEEQEEASAPAPTPTPTPAPAPGEEPLYETIDEIFKGSSKKLWSRPTGSSSPTDSDLVAQAAQRTSPDAAALYDTFNHTRAPSDHQLHESVEAYLAAGEGSTPGGQSNAHSGAALQLAVAVLDVQLQDLLDDVSGESDAEEGDQKARGHFSPLAAPSSAVSDCDDAASDAASAACQQDLLAVPGTTAVQRADSPPASVASHSTVGSLQYNYFDGASWAGSSCPGDDAPTTAELLEVADSIYAEVLEVGLEACRRLESTGPIPDPLQTILHGRITRQQSVDLLSQLDPGTFLVRSKTDTDDTFVVSIVRKNRSIRHVVFDRAFRPDGERGNHYVMDGSVHLYHAQTILECLLAMHERAREAGPASDLDPLRICHNICLVIEGMIASQLPTNEDLCAE